MALATAVAWQCGHRFDCAMAVVAAMAAAVAIAMAWAMAKLAVSRSIGMALLRLATLKGMPGYRRGLS